MAAYHDFDIYEDDQRPDITRQQARIPMYTTIFQYGVSAAVVLGIVLLLIFAFKYVLIALIGLLFAGVVGTLFILATKAAKALIFE